MDYIDPAVGIPVAIILWGIYGYIKIKETRSRQHATANPENHHN